MIELDQALGPLCDLVNECYAALFPKLLGFPEFSISRAMATFWKVKVFNKLQINLFDSFKALLSAERNENIRKGRAKMRGSVLLHYESRGLRMLDKFVQAIADISVNEVKVHLLGSTKLVPDEPYAKLHDIIVANTKYWVLVINRKFYREAARAIHVQYYKETLDTDLILLHKLVLPVTMSKIKEMKQKYLVNYFRFYIEQKLQHYLSRPVCSSLRN